MSLVNNLRVYVALGSGPLSDVTTITWTDITSSVILSAGINYTNGKTYADRVARPGSLTLTLDNSAQKGTAGRWTIGGPNATSGWDLKTPIRVTYVGSTTINLWTGYVDMISSRWDGGVRPVVQVQASDYMAYLSRLNLRNALTAEIIADNPLALWPLDEPSGATRSSNRTANSMGLLSQQKNYAFLGYTITNIAVSGSGTGNVTITTQLQTKVQAGDGITISETQDSANSGTFTVVAVLTGTTFTISNPSAVAQTVTAGYVNKTSEVTEIGGVLWGATPPKPIGADNPNCFYSAVTTLGNGYHIKTNSMPSWNPSTPFDSETIELMYYPTKIMSNGNGLFALEGRSTGISGTCFMTAWVGGSGNLNLTCFVDADAMTSTSSPSQLTLTSDDGVIVENQWHHIVIRQYNPGTPTAYPAMSVWLNGVNLLTHQSGGSSFAATYFTTTNTVNTATQGMRYSTNLHVGGYANNIVNTAGLSGVAMTAAAPGYFANVAIYYSALSDSRIAEHAQIIDGFVGETTHARFNRLCRLASVPTNNYTTLGTPLVTMSPQPFLDSNGQGRSFLDAVREIADTEYGDVYVNGSGQLVHSGRQYRMNQAVDWSIPGNAINSDNGFDYDQTVLINSATVTTGSGDVATSSNAASVAQYGKQELAISSYANLYNQVLSTAQGLANKDATPVPRLRDVNIDLMTLPSNLSDQLETMIGSKVADVFTITGLPSATATSSTLTMFIEGWSDRITERSWTRNVSTTSVTSAYKPIFQLDDSTNGVLLNNPRLTF